MMDTKAPWKINDTKSAEMFLKHFPLLTHIECWPLEKDEYHSNAIVEELIKSVAVFVSIKLLLLPT